MIVKSIATRRVEESRSVADQIAERHAESKLHTEIDRRFGRATNLLRSVCAPGNLVCDALALGGLHLNMHTTTDGLFLEVSHGKIGASRPTPSNLTIRGDVRRQLRRELALLLVHSIRQLTPSRQIAAAENPALAHSDPSRF